MTIQNYYLGSGFDLRQANTSPTCVLMVPWVCAATVADRFNTCRFQVKRKRGKCGLGPRLYSLSPWKDAFGAEVPAGDFQVMPSDRKIAERFPGPELIYEYWIKYLRNILNIEVYIHKIILTLIRSNFMHLS